MIRELKTSLMPKPRAEMQHSRLGNMTRPEARRWGLRGTAYD